MHDDSYDDEDDIQDYDDLVERIRTKKLLALVFRKCGECGKDIAVRWTPDGADEATTSCDQHSMTKKEREERSARLAAQAQPKEAQHDH